MRFLTLGDVLSLHLRIIETTGGRPGVRDLAALESCLAQPHQSFDGSDLYVTLTDKAAALGFSRVANHPFIDGNKRTGHAAMEVFLLLNGLEVSADVDEQEQWVLAVASGQMDRASLARWLASHVKPRCSN